MLPEKFPEINIYWSFEKNKAKEYKSAFQQLVVGQIEIFGDFTVGVAIVENMRRAIPIIIDVHKDVFEDGNEMFCMSGLFNDDYYPAIVFDKFYFDKQKKYNTVLESVYHELGHLYMKHYTRNPKNKMEIYIGRTNAMKNGEVFWQERDADAFACHYLGKELMISHLDELKKMLTSSKSKLNISDYGFDCVLQELDGRIRLIEEL